nr:MAG TPA: hypothetical protein [Caudoviricetes sp.]
MSLALIIKNSKILTHNYQFSLFGIHIYANRLASVRSHISPFCGRVSSRSCLHSVRSSLVRLANSIRCLLRNSSKRSVRLLSHFAYGNSRSLFSLACGIIGSSHSQFGSVVSRFLSFRSSSVSCSLSLACSRVSLVCRSIGSVCSRIGLLDSLVCPRYQVAKFYGRRQHHNSRVHLNRVLSLLWLKHRITLGIVVNKHYLLIFITSPRTAKQLALHLKGIRTQSHLRALHSHLKQRVVLNAYRMRHFSTAESINKVHLHLLASRQWKLLRLSAHDFPYWHTQRKIITSYYLFHIVMF